MGGSGRAIFAQLAYRYGFSLVITPIFEDVGVFNRGIGEKSDVSKKEMYVFDDRGERRLRVAPRRDRVGRSSLRPAPARRRPGRRGT